MLKLLFKIILFYYLFLNIGFSKETLKINCKNFEYERIKNLKIILEKDINTSILIDTDCKLYTKQEKNIKFNEKVLNTYEDIFNFK